MAKYYKYRQNNTGGSFAGPAINVFVEADTPEEADSIAVKNGLYFDGEGDCDCCGDRWYKASEYDEVPGPDEEFSDLEKKFGRWDDVPLVLVIEKELSNG